MTTGTTPKTLLEGLITCGNCGAQVRYDEDTGDEETGNHGALYVCSHEHLTGTEVRLPADTTGRLVLGGVLNAILTREGVATVQSEIAEHDEDGRIRSAFPLEDITLLEEDLCLFLGEASRAEEANAFLSTFINRIELFPDRAVVRYVMPLPPASRLAGASEQEIPLPA